MFGGIVFMLVFMIVGCDELFVGVVKLVVGILVLVVEM